MSNRQVLSPDLASAQLLDSLLRRIESLERRSRWGGATQFAELAAPVTLTDNAWVDTVSITLGAGRWMLYGSATLDTPVVHELVQIRFPTYTDSVPSGSSAYISGYGDGRLTLSVVGSVNLAAEATVPLQGWSTNSSSGVDVPVAFMIAVPT